MIRVLQNYLQQELMCQERIWCHIHCYKYPVILFKHIIAMEKVLTFFVSEFSSSQNGKIIDSLSRRIMRLKSKLYSIHRLLCSRKMLINILQKQNEWKAE